jgi:hypothetical protein
MLTSAGITSLLAPYDLGTLSRIRPAIPGYVSELTIIKTSRGWFIVWRNYRRLDDVGLHYRHAPFIWLRVCGLLTSVTITLRDPRPCRRRRL